MLLSCMNSLYMLDINPSLDIWLSIIFSHLIGYLCILLIISFTVQQLFSSPIGLFLLLFHLLLESDPSLLMNPKRSTPRYIIIKMAKFKDKERILKSSKRKADSHLQGRSHKTVSWFFNRNISGQKGLVWNIQSDEKQGPTTKTTWQGYHLKLEKQRASQTRKG